MEAIDGAKAEADLLGVWMDSPVVQGELPRGGLLLCGGATLGLDLVVSFMS